MIMARSALRDVYTALDPNASGESVRLVHICSTTGKVSVGLFNTTGEADVCLWVRRETLTGRYLTSASLGTRISCASPPPRAGRRTIVIRDRLALLRRFNGATRARDLGRWRILPAYSPHIEVRSGP